MVRNYKTGPRRSRRRPDPSAVPLPRTQQLASLVTVDNPAVGDLLFILQPVLDSDGTDIDVEGLKLTEGTTRIVVVDSAGTVFPCDVEVTSGGSLEITQQSTQAAGTARLVIPGFIEEIRGANGEWIGAQCVEFEITP